MKKLTSKVVKVGGDARLNAVHGAVFAQSLREGPAWLTRIYDEQARRVNGYAWRA